MCFAMMRLTIAERIINMMPEVRNDKLKDLIVVKRSGQRVDFNSTKIAIAIKKAFDQVEPFNSEKKINKVYEAVVKYIEENYHNRKTINVEDIQDIIENKLKENSFKNVYTAFSDYRIRRAASRQAFGIKQQHKFAKAIERIINDNKDAKNFDGNPSDVLRNFGKTISCEYTKTYVLDNKLVRAHEEGSIYIQNLDYFNLGKLSSAHLKFNTNVEADFPHELIRVATNAKDEIDGEICIDSLDRLIKPMVISKFKNKFINLIDKYLGLTYFSDYVNMDKLKEIIMKENTINIDLEMFDTFALNKRVKDIFDIAYKDAITYIIDFVKRSVKNILLSLNNNYYENKKYSISVGSCDSYECLLISNIYLDILKDLEELANVYTIFKVRKNSDSTLLTKASELVLLEKNISFAFDDASYNKNEYESVEYFSDGKRIFENPIYESVGSTGRMITSSISINMGRLGLRYQNKDLKEFYESFDELLELTKNGLINIFEVIGDKTRKSYRAIFNNNFIDDDKLETDQKIRKIIKKGVLNLELAGLTECVKTLESDSEKQKLLLREILEYANKKCKLYTQEAKLNFVISETSKHRPLRKLMEFDKAIYGIQKGITDKDAYGRLEKLFEFKKDIDKDLEYIGEYQKLLSGGNFVKIELNKSAKVKNVLEIINSALLKDVGFIKIVIGK